MWNRIGAGGDQPEQDLHLQSELNQFITSLSHLNNALAFSSLTSTNDFAILLEKNGQISGTIITAARQHRGRGRLERRWFMREGDIAVSIILRPPHLPKNLALMPMVAALAVLHAISSLGGEVKLKWPNDIIMAGAFGTRTDYFAHFYKVGGILVENVFCNNALSASIIGIGLNLTTNSALKKVVPHAASLKDQLPSISRSLCLPKILAHLDQYIMGFGDEAYEHKVFQDYINNCETLGKKVIVDSFEKIIGYARTVKIDGSLVIDDGVNEHVIFAGDVQRMS